MKISETSMCTGTLFCNKNKEDAFGEKTLVKKYNMPTYRHHSTGLRTVQTTHTGTVFG